MRSFGSLCSLRMTGLYSIYQRSHAGPLRSIRARLWVCYFQVKRAPCLSASELRERWKYQTHGTDRKGSAWICPRPSRRSLVAALCRDDRIDGSVGMTLPPPINRRLHQIKQLAQCHRDHRKIRRWPMTQIFNHKLPALYQCPLLLLPTAN